MMSAKKNFLRWGLCLVSAALMTGACGSHDPAPAIVVNSLEDTTEAQVGMTLRTALEQAGSGERITFDPALNGKTILLTIVGESHSILKGEVYSAMTFQGYADRDYGRSALYAAKNVVLDASSLPDGITIAWDGGDASRARVLAVSGNLTMKNVTIRSGYSSAEAITGGTQPYTLGRGGGLAVWGTARLENCTISGNTAEGDLAASRDRGTYGGGIYANGLELTGCIISGNAAIGYGAAGGGIYSVGGADNPGGVGNDVTLTACTVSGNRVTAQHAYGGGIFTLAGGPLNLAWMHLVNCTIARNVVEDNPAIADAGQFYYRGGGVYMGGGSLEVVSSTIVENQVNGTMALFSGKPNMAGGGVTATIGNAHVVEYVRVRHSIVAGNTLNGESADWGAGSLLDFTSGGYNLFGTLDFSQILVPVPDWMNTNRKHYPKAGDREGVALGEALSVDQVHRHPTILSAGADAGQAAVLWYPPAAAAVDEIPAQPYGVVSTYAGYVGGGFPTDDFLNHVLEKIRTEYAAILGADFGTSFGDMTGVTFYGPAVEWPSNPENGPWIAFWRNLDTAIAGRLGMAGLGDDFWGTFTTGPLDDYVTITVQMQTDTITLIGSDQLGKTRPSGAKGDIGAIEL